MFFGQRRPGVGQMPLVQLKATLAKAAGEKEFEAQAKKVAEILDIVSRRYEGKVDKYLKNAIVLVNGKNVNFIDGRETKLKKHDVVSIYPPIGGG